MLCIMLGMPTGYGLADASAPTILEDSRINYIVQSGDTLSHIAITFNTNVAALMRINDLISTVIYPNQEIRIPASSDVNMATSRGNISRDDLMLLARAIHAEARGETFEGQVAVGAVILNRLHSAYFPNTIGEVIMQRQGNVYQFTPVADGTINLTPDEIAIKAAWAALEGNDPTGGALFFYNPHLASDVWIKTLPVVTTIGRHAFATTKT